MAAACRQGGERGRAAYPSSSKDRQHDPCFRRSGTGAVSVASTDVGGDTGSGTPSTIGLSTTHSYAPPPSQQRRGSFINFSFYPRSAGHGGQRAQTANSRQHHHQQQQQPQTSSSHVGPSYSSFPQSFPSDMSESDRSQVVAAIAAKQHAACEASAGAVTETGSIKGSDCSTDCSPMRGCGGYGYDGYGYGCGVVDYGDSSPDFGGSDDDITDRSGRGPVRTHDVPEYSVSTVSASPSAAAKGHHFSSTEADRFATDQHSYHAQHHHHDPRRPVSPPPPPPALVVSESMVNYQFFLQYTYTPECALLAYNFTASIEQLRVFAVFEPLPDIRHLAVKLLYLLYKYQIHHIDMALDLALTLVYLSEALQLHHNDDTNTYPPPIADQADPSPSPFPSPSPPPPPYHSVTDAPTATESTTRALSAPAAPPGGCHVRKTSFSSGGGKSVANRGTVRLGDLVVPRSKGFEVVFYSVYLAHVWNQDRTICLRDWYREFGHESFRSCHELNCWVLKLMRGMRHWKLRAKPEDIRAYVSGLCQAPRLGE
ncbi:unnamed protein product [Vitrella brassicaformis CCMP3155]|uniref:Uncharacterized protein n=2 Tax=Vitrella brassicaformis TaxID=1169539 RepID=A0A0G4F1G3_VITBC|nr:unnamed protein product [Vitrella brassicaformis CCMP3155]|eukprot:CEM05230.1 unnamed protein product [Vitrella brassicaformis CCMP3155]